jgi:hypothetical protein
MRTIKRNPALKYAVKTSLNSMHQEVSAAIANQYDLTIAMRKIASPGGVDKTLLDCEEDEGT